MAHQEKDGYDPSAVEEKWQRLWEERGTNSFTREELDSLMSSERSRNSCVTLA